VFLAAPQVPLDTNQLEREIRAIALGRRNWLFCWTEVGAQEVGMIQSLIASCRLQGVDPYVYLVDVLQRIDTHPAFEVHLLTPRLWKQHFAATHYARISTGSVNNAAELPLTIELHSRTQQQRVSLECRKAKSLRQED
jgi:hypothetical protein